MFGIVIGLTIMHESENHLSHYLYFSNYYSCRFMSIKKYKNNLKIGGAVIKKLSTKIGIIFFILWPIFEFWSIRVIHS